MTAVPNVLDRFRLDGKTALVTGGARGLGLTMATALAQVGADIVIAGRSLAAGEEAAKSIAAATGRTATAYAADVTNAADVDRLWFLADQSDPELRSDFVADAIATGHPELLDRARSLLGDDDQEVREAVAIGLRNAMRATTSTAYIDEAASILLDYLHAHPKDSDSARMMARQFLSPDAVKR